VDIMQDPELGIWVAVGRIQNPESGIWAVVDIIQDLEPKMGMGRADGLWLDSRTEVVAPGRT
jgi:hypothetical protein